MARVLAEGAVEIVPDDTGFAGELRSDLNRDLTAATAGLDKTVTVRVTTDADVAEKQIRAALASVQRVSDALTERIQAKTLALTRRIAEQIVKIRTKILVETQKTRDKINLLLAPFWAKLRTHMNAVADGWRRIAASASAAADTVRERFTDAQAAVSRGWRTVADGAARAGRQISAAFEPGLARIRVGIERLQRPFQVVRAYGTATFRIVGDAGARAFDRVRVRAAALGSSASSAFTRIRSSASSTFRTVGDVGSRAFTRLGRASRVAGRGIGADFRNIGVAVRAMGRDVERGGRAFRVLGERVEKSGKLGKVAGGLFSGVGKIMQGVSGAAGTLTGSLKLVGGGFLDIGKSVLGAVGPLVKFGAVGVVIGAVLGAITFAVGAAGAAFAGLPALVGAAAVSFGVFKLGMEGIKRAYESSLKPAIEQMKTQIENTFERILTPAFRRLSDELIPQITDGMNDLAAAFAEGGVQIIDMVNKSENIAKINDLISNTIAAVRDQLVPALKNIIQAFIDIGANSSILRDMVGIFTDLTNKTAAWLSKMNESGRAAEAVSNLRSVLSSVVDLFFRLLDGAVTFFNAATPGMNSLLDSIRPNEDIMRRLGTAFGDAARAAGDFIRNLPPSVFDDLTTAAESLSSALDKIANSPGLMAFFANLASVVKGASQALDGLASAVGFVADAFNFVTGGVGEFLADLRDVTGAAKPGATAQENYAEKTREAGDAAAAAAPQIGQMPGPFNAAADAAAHAGQGITTGFVPPVQALPGQVGSALAPLPGAVQAPADAAAAAAKAGADKAAADAAAGFAPIPPDAQAALSGLAPAVQGAMDQAAAAATSGTERIRSAVQTGFAQAAAAAAPAMTSIAQVVESNMQSAGASAEVGGQRIGNGIRAGADQAANAASAALPRVAQSVQQAMGQAGAAAETGGARIANAVRAGADQAAAAAQAGMERVPAAVTAAMSSAAAAAESGGQRIAQALRSSTEQAAAAAEAGMTRIATAVRTGMQQSVQAATQGGQQIQRALQTALDATVRLTESSWQRIVAAFQRGGQQAVASARSTGQQVVAVFTALAGAMFAAGSNLINRLAAGMIAAQGAAFAAAASTAAGIRARFPSSPAKEGPLSGSGDPLRSGRTIVERLAAGIAASGSVVNAALQPILSSLVARVNTATVNPMVDAAREILARIQSRGQLFEDLSWKGMSSNASNYNDALLDAQDRSGIRDTKAFLEDFIRRNTATAAAGPDGGVLAELKAQTAVLLALRGDVSSSGYSASLLERLDKLIEVMSDGSRSAAEKAQGMRDLAGMGAF